ncbi:hypothetical protein QE152_g34883 [Popillia japonica]|uniref:Uncharacterized protein n=1 Tax=Popillia japonica TaxID=7064 RepID=A0AAW1ISU1_POPJA
MMVDSADGELSVLKFKRGQIKSQVTRFKTFLSNFDAHSDVLDLEVRLQTMWMMNGIPLKIPILKQLPMQNALFQTEINPPQVLKQLADAKRIISNRNKPTPSTSSTQFESDGSVSAGFIADTDSRSRVKLPRLNLPEFHDLEVRLQTLERGTLEEFNDIQSKIEALQNQIIQDDERNTFENTYFKTIADAKRIISNRNKPTPSTSSTQFESHYFKPK